MSRVIKNLKIGSGSVNCSGFSFIELLVAMVLGLLLLEVLLQNYLGAKNLYRDQTELATLSENIRFADFTLWQNVMHAGYAGARRLSELKLDNHTKIDFDLFNAIHGYDTNLPDYLSGRVIKGTDVIVIAKATSDISKITSDVKAGVKSLQVVQNPATINNNLLLISDCVNADLFAAKNYRGNTIYSEHKLSGVYKAGRSEIARFEELAFFISDTSRIDGKGQPIYALYFSTNRGNKRELVSGVSNMQIYYGVDSREVGRVEKYLKAAMVNHDKLWGQVLSVIIKLTMKSQLLMLEKNMYIKLRERG